MSTSACKTLSRTTTTTMLLCLLLGVPTVGIAETEFWVVVGSYPDLESAERGLERANATLEDSFDVRGADTDSDYVYRVAAGPYLNRELALAGVSRALDSGFNGAWLFAERADPNQESTAGTLITTAANDTGDEPVNRNAPRSGQRFDGRYDSGMNRKDAESPSLQAATTGTDRQSSAEAEPDARLRENISGNGEGKLPTLVEEAPSNYGLHKLRRD